MIYNDDKITKRGIEASVLSIKNDLNRRIGRVQLKYTEIYDAIVAESNGLVDFVNEFRAAVNTIVNECNDLQGLTDEELTEIKQRIEELKQILDSIEIPDLPKIKKPEEIFIEDTNNDDDEENEPTYIPVDIPNPMPESNNPDSTAFFCGDYSASVNDGDLGDPVCKRNYVIWANNMDTGACVTEFDEETYEAGRTNGYTGCMSKYEANDMNCYSGFATSVTDVETASGTQVCIRGFSAQNGTNCEGDYVQDTIHRDCAINFSNAAGENCTEEYYFDGTNINCDKFSGYGMQCPESYAYGTSLETCSHGYNDGHIDCKTNYGFTPGSQSITKCKDGFGMDDIKCPSNWSYGLGKNACNSAYSDENITCAKGYITDGAHTWCDYPDGACGPCQSGYCSPANYSPCQYCPGYTPSCGEDEPCSEGEPPCAWPPPCDDSEPCGESEPCYQEPTCQPCVTLTDTCGGPYGCNDSCYPVCVLGHDDCTGVCNVIRHGSND